MMNQFTSRIVITVWIFAIANQVCTIWGLNTQKCTHNELRSKLQCTINCLMKIQPETDYRYDYLAEGETNAMAKSTLNEFCGITGDVTECFTQRLGTCFDAELTADLSMMLDFELRQLFRCYYWNYEETMDSGPTYEGSGSKTGYAYHVDYPNDGYANAYPYEDYMPDIEDVMRRLIWEFSFDKQCEIYEVIESLRDQNLPCICQKLSPI